MDASEPDLVVLAGFMRILGAAFVRRYEGRMLNIHPSLLPAYPGLDTHRRALADGARVHGCTVHYVTPEVDHGPIVAQRSLEVVDGDDPESLAARVLALEHQLLPAAVRAWCEGRHVIDGRRDRVKEDLRPLPRGNAIRSPQPNVNSSTQTMPTGHVAATVTATVAGIPASAAGRVDARRCGPAL